MAPTALYIYVCIIFIDLIEYQRSFEWFCCLVVFLIFKAFCKLHTKQFLSLGKFCPTPGEFDHHFLPRGRELDKKIGWDY